MKYHCPFCAGHDWRLLSNHQSRRPSPPGLATNVVKDHLAAELTNIRNAILNQAERETTPPWEKLPQCPTPTKRKYSNLEHAHYDAVRWNQHPYTCVCTYVHLSKQTATEHAAKISTPPATADEFEDIIDPLLT